LPASILEKIFDQRQKPPGPFFGPQQKLLLALGQIPHRLVQDDGQLLLHGGDRRSKLMGDHGDELRFHLVQFLKGADVLEDGDGAHDLAQVVSHGSRMGPEVNLPGGTHVQFLGDGAIGPLFCPQTLLDGGREFRGELRAGNRMSHEGVLRNLEHPVGRRVGQDGRAVLVAHENSISHGVDDRNDL
jgi:hypothetical protein